MTGRDAAAAAKEALGVAAAAEAAHAEEAARSRRIMEAVRGAYAEGLNDSVSPTPPQAGAARRRIDDR